MFFWHAEAQNFKMPYFLPYHYIAGEPKLGPFGNEPVVTFQLTGEMVLPMRTDGISLPTEESYWNNRMMDRYIRAYRIQVTQVNFTFAMFVMDIKNVNSLKVNRQSII